MSEYDDRLFVIAKQSGPTSFEVVEAFRRACRIRKVGHAGTLDPLARGVLLLCTGKATRAVEHFMNLEKVYEFEVHLGVGTTTLDAEGEVVSEAPCPDLALGDIEQAAAAFVGEYRLEPPAFSAVKQNGRRLYEIARSGETARVASRTVRILEMSVLSVSLPRVGLRVRCTRGTYVRSLARDFGAKLGVPAHIARLVRTAVGSFRVEDGFPGERLFERDIEGLAGVKIADAVAFLPGIVLRESSVPTLMNGALPTVRDVLEMQGSVGESGAVRILDQAGELLAIGSRTAGAERRGLALVDSFRLFVNRGS